MSLIEKVRSLVSDGQEETYAYECGDCGTEFESPARNPNDASCPDCGSDFVHSSL